MVRPQTSVFWSPCFSRRLPRVGVLSSLARMPLPRAARARATSSRDSGGPMPVSSAVSGAGPHRHSCCHGRPALRGGRPDREKEEKRRERSEKSKAREKREERREKGEGRRRDRKVIESERPGGKRNGG